MVDSPGVDSNAYLQDLVQNSTLGELMQKGAELAAGKWISPNETRAHGRCEQSARFETLAGL